MVEFDEKVVLNGGAHLNGHALFVRQGVSDEFHGLRWSGSVSGGFPGSPDGPVLFGFGGGALATDQGPNARETALAWDRQGPNARKVALTWDSNQGVAVHGNLSVTGDIGLQNADVAEQFSLENSDDVQPGDVVVLGDDVIRRSTEPYDRRVAGVISGAGSYRPGIVLDAQAEATTRASVALVGKVYCRVDADAAGPIDIGDLLTTSATPGHAMRAIDRDQAFGATLGKALRGLSEGRGLVPVLVALQ